MYELLTDMIWENVGLGESSQLGKSSKSKIGKIWEGEKVKQADNLYNKTIYIYVAYSRPNGWTDWG